MVGALHVVRDLILPHSEIFNLRPRVGQGVAHANPGSAERDDIAWPDLRLCHALLVHVCPVGALQIDGEHDPVAELYTTLLSGEKRVFQGNIDFTRPADDERAHALPLDNAALTLSFTADLEPHAIPLHAG